MLTVGVHVICQNELKEVLLVRKNYLEKDWVPPGGMLEDGESINEAAVRECFEETGYAVEVVSLVAIASRPKTNDLIIALEAKIKEKNLHAIDPTEISEVAFFSLDKLPSPMKPEVKGLLEMFSSGARGAVVAI